MDEEFENPIAFGLSPARVHNIFDFILFVAELVLGTANSVGVVVGGQLKLGVSAVSNNVSFVSQSALSSSFELVRARSTLSEIRASSFETEQNFSGRSGTQIHGPPTRFLLVP